MIVNKCSENLLKKSKKLYENYRDNCTVVQRMLEKYKKIYPNISDYSIMHFIDIAEFCDLIMDRKKLESCRTRLVAGQVDWIAEPLAFIQPGEILPCCCRAKGDIEIEM